MWSNKKSIILSKIFTIVMMVALAAILIFGPQVIDWVIFYSVNAHKGNFAFFVTTVYSGGIFAAILLICLYRLLDNIGKQQVFENSNVSYLRIISWCCFVGAGISVLSGIYYMPWFVVAVAAAFVGLIVRVVKNILEQAIHIKQENDFTI